MTMPNYHYFRSSDSIHVSHDKSMICTMLGANVELNKINAARIAAERTAAELRAQLDKVTAQLESVTVQRDAAEAWLQVAQVRITELEGYIDKHNQRVLSKFAHTAPPTDWDQETPYGQMLDRLGDEVEP